MQLENTNRTCLTQQRQMQIPLAELVRSHATGLQRADWVAHTRSDLPSTLASTSPQACLLIVVSAIG
jgi:hypothetical protein